jgi:hypothetical protein
MLFNSRNSFRKQIKKTISTTSQLTVQRTREDALRTHPVVEFPFIGRDCLLHLTRRRECHNWIQATTEMREKT